MKKNWLALATITALMATMVPLAALAQGDVLVGQSGSADDLVLSDDELMAAVPAKRSSEGFSIDYMGSVGISHDKRLLPGVFAELSRGRLGASGLTLHQYSPVPQLQAHQYSPVPQPTASRCAWS